MSSSTSLIRYDEARWNELLEEQKQMEASAYADGAAAFRKRLTQAAEKGQASTVGAAKKLMQLALEQMSWGIQQMCEGGRGGRKHTAVKWCKMVGYDEAAYMTLRVVFDGIALPHRDAKTVALRIASLLIDELRFRRFKEKMPTLYEYRFKKFNTSSYTHMAKSLTGSIMLENIDCSDISLRGEQKLLLGIKLLDILISSTGIVEIKRTKPTRRFGTRQFRSATEVVPTAATWKWLEARNGALEMLQPLVQPMVVPPLDWGKGYRGGYRFALRGSYNIARRVSKTQAAKLDRTSMPLVYKAMNTLQHTAWKINHTMLNVIKDSMSLGGGYAGIPLMEDELMPAKPQDIDTNDEARKKWRKEAHAAKERNHLRRQHAKAAVCTIEAAQKLAKHDAFYFPYSLDFRGRIYPISSYLTPQGDDLARSLMVFADGRPVDTVAAQWLAIHGANCMDDTEDGQKLKKLPMEDRIQWVYTNTPRILKTAADPFADLWWSKGDKPLQFLAFCFEWAGLLEANDKGEEYVCALPCSMDGSCNGLQHFSALLRDEIGGAAVNVVPGPAPQDVYEKVALNVLDRLTNLAVFDDLAALWLGLHSKVGIVDRKLTKRPTMTFAYGAKQFGFREQLQKYLNEHHDVALIRKHFAQEVGYSRLPHACEFMAALIWWALNDIVVKSFEGMAWLHQAVKGISKRSKPVEWVVPVTGFPVRQEYYQQARKQVLTELAGKIYGPRISHDTDFVNSRKQTNGISPNFIHSLDAAALMLTISMAHDEGVEQFAMIHDSYGTLPADCALLARCCRQAFAKLYMQQDVADHLYQQLKAQWEKPEECPAPPAKGTLDVSRVLASPYFFA